MTVKRLAALLCILLLLLPVGACAAEQQEESEGEWGTVEIVACLAIAVTLSELRRKAIDSLIMKGVDTIRKKQREKKEQTQKEQQAS